MALQDLTVLYSNVEDLVSNFDGKEIKLTDYFKEKYEELITDSEEIEYLEKTAIFKNSNKQVTYIPNQWFLVAFLGSRIIEALEEYKKLADECIPDTNDSDVNELFEESKNINNDSSHEPKLVTFIKDNPDISDDDKEKLIMFVTNYESWYGGKTISRHDYYQSPLLKITNLVHANASMVYSIANKFIKDEILSGYIDDPMELFIIDDKMSASEPTVSEHPDDNKKIRENKNIIYYGAPGTGKSYEVDELIKEEYANYHIDNDEDAKFVYRTTIYPDYSYHDFVGQIMPKIENGNVSYVFEPGIFTRALSVAKCNRNKNVYLVIEEMSRGDIASIFGDIFQLLDRDQYGESVFPITNENIAKEIERFRLKNEEDTSLTDEDLEKRLNEIDFYDYQIKLPSNFLIYSTVNTSDQNVFVLDTAFKRRFNFKYLSVDPIKDDKGNYINNFNFELDNDLKTVSWIAFYQAINKYIQSELSMPEDKLIGQFFIKGKFPKNESGNANEFNNNQIADKLLQYLWDDIEKINAVTGTQASLFALNKEEKQFSKIYNKFKNNDKIFDELIYSYIEEFSVDQYNIDLKSSSLDKINEALSDVEEVIEGREDTAESLGVRQYTDSGSVSETDE